MPVSSTFCPNPAGGIWIELLYDLAKSLIIIIILGWVIAVTVSRFGCHYKATASNKYVYLKT